MHIKQTMRIMVVSILKQAAQLETLNLANVGFNCAADGDNPVDALGESTVTSLQYIDLSSNPGFFRSEAACKAWDEILNRQKNLKMLHMTMWMILIMILVRCV